jgi:hypothetical protein
MDSGARYALPVKTIWTSPRLNQAAAKYGEVAPTAAVCCNACRTCVQTNLLTLALAAVAGAGIAVARFARRLLRRSAVV